MTEMTTILIVDDEIDFARGLARLVQDQFPDCELMTVASADQALEALNSRKTGVLLTDLRMPGIDGFELLQQALRIDPSLSVVIISAYGSIEKAVEALKHGAYDFLTKPLDYDHLFRILHKALERFQLLEENRQLRQRAMQCEDQDFVFGDAPATVKLKQSLHMVAQNDYTVLIQGESGTGKELASRVIHGLSQRRNNQLVTVNCPAIPDHLLESELFGHVKGSFTGAESDHKGLFMTADKGTILLDEIGDISPSVQTKLLRVLQEQEVRPVGANQSIQVDVRVLATTNQNLQHKMQSGSFREDLYYRLNVLNITLPSLRDRKEDIPLLTHTFIRKACDELQIGVKTITPEALSTLSARQWPGNIRELLNFVRRLVVFCPREEIDLGLIRFLNDGDHGPPEENESFKPYKEAKNQLIEDFTRSYVMDVLARSKGNVSEAARMSGLDRVSLQKILRRLHIPAERFRST